MNNFHYGLSLCQTLYGIDLQDDTYEEIGLVAWNQIGNKKTRIYKYTICLDPCNSQNGKYEVELPCNVDIIEAVTSNFEDWVYSSNTSNHGHLDSAITEQYIENRKKFHNPLYASGKFLKYERVGNTLYFDQPYPQINILYRGIILDDEGLPEITDKEALAIATYCAYVTKYKEGLMTNNPNIVNTAQILQKQWYIHCDQARVDTYIDQNKIDEILEAKNCWNRKIFNYSYKMYK